MNREEAKQRLFASLYGKKQSDDQIIQNIVTLKLQIETKRVVIHDKLLMDLFAEIAKFEIRTHDSIQVRPRDTPQQATLWCERDTKQLEITFPGHKADIAWDTCYYKVADLQFIAHRNQWLIMPANDQSPSVYGNVREEDFADNPEES